MLDYIPPGVYRWEQAWCQKYSSQLPFSLERIRDYDDLGRNTKLVAELPDRRLYYVGSSLYWAHTQGEQVVEITFLEGLQARDAMVEHGWRLPERQRQAIFSALQPGVLWSEARREVERQPHLTLRLLDDRPNSRGFRRQYHRVLLRHPWRSSLLSVQVDAERLVSASLLEGRVGYERLVQVLFRTGQWPRPVR